MNFKAHTIGGMLSGMAAMTVLGEGIVSPAGILILSGATLGGLLPDVDHRGSYLGKKMKGVSFVVNKTMGHRGATHAPFVFGTIIAAIHIATRGLGTPLHPFMIGIIVGMFSHIFLDSLTIGGVPWMYPFKKKKYSFLPMKTGGPGEDAVTFIMSAFSIFLIAQELFKIKPW